MGTGYTRNDTPNNIADGNVINASDLDGEFDAIQAAFNATTGHSHDGTTGEGPQIGTGGIADNAVTLGTKTSGNYVAAGAVSGVGLSGSASSEGATFTVTSNATSANTASTIVARDASGNFSAGTITASLTGTASNAALLDSLDSTQFLRSDAADTKTAGDLSFDNNVKATFGGGSELTIWSNGSNSLIQEAGTGSLFIDASDLQLRNTGGTEIYFMGTSGGSTQLRHANSQKLATTSSGIDVTGTVTADGLTVDGASVFNQAASDQSGGAAVKANGTAYGTNKSIHAYMNTSSASKSLIYAENGAGSVFNVDGAGDISFYDSTGVTQGFYWDASTQRLGLGTTSPAKLLEIAAANTGASENNVLRLTDLDTAVVLNQPAGSIEWYTSDGDAVTSKIGAVYAGTGAGSSLVFSTAPTAATGISERLRIDEDGNVGIGSASPSTNLEINGGTNNNIVRIVSTDANANIEFADNTTTSGLQIGANGDNMKFGISGAEAMRIDSSGNLLVGKTSANFATAGATLYPSGMTEFTRDGDKPLKLNRLTSDGDIAIFAKDGTTVGSIGSRSSGTALQIYTSSTGIDFGGDGILPMVGSTITDNSRDIGSSSYRFKDAHFGGTVNVGTAVAATQTASVTGSTTLDFSTYQNFILTMTGNITLANPTTEQAGQSGFIILIHSGAARTVSLGTDYETAGAAGLTLSGTAGAVDLVPYVVQSSGNILLGAPQLAFA